MELISEFSKMQCLFTGNRFSGLNIESTKIQTDFSIESSNIVKLTVMLVSNISYLEVEDEVKYQQYATVELAKSDFSNSNLLIEIIKGLKQELRRKYENSNIFKFLEIKDPQDFPDSMIYELVNRMLADFNKAI